MKRKRLIAEIIIYSMVSIFGFIYIAASTTAGVLLWTWLVKFKQGLLFALDKYTALAVMLMVWNGILTFVVWKKRS